MLSLFDQMQRTRRLRQYILFLSAVVLFHSVVYYPVYLFLASDVAWKSSIVFFLWTEIAEPLSVYLFFWGSFAYLLYAGIRFSPHSAIPYLVAYGAGSVLRYALQNVCFIFMMGLPSWQRSFSLPAVLWNILLDFLIMGVVYFFFLLLMRKLRGDGKPAIEVCFPLEGFFNFGNVLAKVAVAAAVIPSAARLATRVYYDIRTIAFEGRAPSGAPEIFLMITYYVTDILTALLGYLIIFMMLSSFHLSDVRARMHFDEK